MTALAHQQNTQHQHQQPRTDFRVTELLIPVNQQSDTIVNPLVCSLSRQNTGRWLTWITHRRVSKALLDTLGADPDKIRIIHTEKNADNRWLIWESLALGNSHTIIADTGVLEEKDLRELERAAARGNTTAICIRELGRGV